MEENRYGGWSLDRFRDGEADDVQRLIDEGRTERHNLEYKDGRIFGDANANHEIISEIASLANSGGGVLILGVATDKLDVPQGIRGTERAIDIGWLNDLCVSGMQPPVDPAGYEVRSFPDPNDARRLGYTIFVPESVRAPHMVVSEPKQKDRRNHYGRYLCRSHSGRQVMLDAHVRDMMGRRRRPELCLEVAAASEWRPPNVWIWLTLINRGRALAFAPRCVFYIDPKWCKTHTVKLPETRELSVPPGAPITRVWAPRAPLVPEFPESYCVHLQYRPEGPDKDLDRQSLAIGARLYAEDMEPVACVLRTELRWDGGGFDILRSEVVRLDRDSTDPIANWNAGPYR